MLIHKYYGKTCPFFSVYPIILEGGTFVEIVHGCACHTSKIWLSLYMFFTKSPTNHYTIFERKVHNFTQISGAFYLDFLKVYPIYVNLTSYIFDKNPPITIPNFQNNVQRHHIIIPIHVNVRHPPPRCNHIERVKLNV